MGMLPLIAYGRAIDQMIGYSLSLSWLGKEVWAKEDVYLVVEKLERVMKWYIDGLEMVV